jgi:hypothetical protein
MTADTATDPTLTADERTALARWDQLATWGNPYLSPVRVAALGGEFTSRADFVTALRGADGDQLAACLSELTALQDRADVERRDAEENNPFEAMDAERLAEATRAAQFRQTTDGRLERVIELLEELVGRGSQA